MLKFTSTVLAAAVAAKNITVDKATRTFRDEFNRARIFHGQNVVIKLPNYLPTQGDFDYQMSLNDQDLQYLQDWGTKLIRLGVMWESVETAPGVYDYAYLDAVDALITKIGAYGMTVIVDNHQDLFSRSLCGEGVPHFYTPTDLEHTCPKTILGELFKLANNCISLDSYNFTKDADGLPLTSECQKQSFITMYTAPEIASAFDALYKNQNGLYDKMMAYWTVVAQRFNANPNVIGYDILNEPWTANIYHNKDLFLKPTSFDHDILFPLTQRATQTIRGQDATGVIFFEAAQFPDTLPFAGGIVEPIGFPDTPGGSNDTFQALNDHSYCCQVSGKMCETGAPPLDKSGVCRDFHFQKASVRNADAVRLGVPLIFTEFGACFDNLECATEINNSMDAFESQLASWAYWQYKGFGDFTTTGGAAEGMFAQDGVPQHLKLKAITRTYVHAYKGTPVESFFSTETGSFVTKFNYSIKITADTELYMNRDQWYPYGSKLSMAYAANGKTVEGITKYIAGGNAHYTGFSFFDDLHQDGRDIQIMVTPSLVIDANTASGVASNGKTYSMAWKFTDTGADAICSFNLSWANTPHALEAHIINRNHTSIHTFLQQTKSLLPAANEFNCADLIDGKIILMSKSTGFLTPSKEVASISLVGMNGHSLDINIAEAASEVFLF